MPRPAPTLSPVARLVASFFGSGLIIRTLRGKDSGSGTVGGLAAAAVGLWVGRTTGWQWVLALAVLTVVAGMAAIRALYTSHGDAGWIVVDEAAGAFLALVGITSVPAALVAFGVFRLADIFKRVFPGVARAEDIPGPTGVMADDLVAGIYGLLAGHIVQRLV